MSCEDDDIIELNVGGTDFTTTRATLCYVKDSTLAAMFSGRWQNDDHLTSSGKIFLDYNPILFVEIIKYFQQCIYQNQTHVSDREHVPSPTFESLAESEEFETLCDYLGIQQVILSYPPIKDDDVNVVKFAAQYTEFDIRDINKIIVSGPNEGKTWLLVAAEEGNKYVVLFLLQQEADVDAVDGCHKSALWHASCEGHLECLKILIDYGADVNKCDLIYADTAITHIDIPVDGVTPTSIAAENGHVKCLKTLIESGADVDKGNFFGFTPTYIAAQHGRVECLQTLIDSGADVNKCSLYGYSPTYIAANNGKVECLEILIAFGADVNKCDDDGVTPTFVVSRHDFGHGECLKALIAAGADVNKCNANGTSPVHIAAANGHAECLMTLIDASADVNECNVLGRTPTYLAATNGHANCIQILFDAKANILIPAKNGQTPLDAAIAEKEDSCIQLWKRGKAEEEESCIQLLTKLMNNNKE